eukprot:SAG31_NODE_2485_length_5624_cov_2.110206_6_plen_51_part_00
MRTWWRYTRSLNFGITLPIGQPVADWQNGVPQSMQRAACVCRCSGVGSTG